MLQFCPDKFHIFILTSLCIPSFVDFPSLYVARISFVCSVARGGPGPCQHQTTTRTVSRTGHSFQLSPHDCGTNIRTEHPSFMILRQSLQESAGVTPRMTRRLLPSTRSPVHYSWNQSAVGTDTL
jgi:hypothetical protein